LSEENNPEQTTHAKAVLARSIDYKRTFGSEQGKRVLADLMANYYMYQTTFAATPHEMAIREGGRSVVMNILAEMNINPEKLRDLIRENLNGTTS
jgi:hypothetical protein